MTILSGSLVIHATSAVDRLDLEVHKDAEISEGTHLAGVGAGGWTTWTHNTFSDDILIPARNKEQRFTTTNEESKIPLATTLSSLDSQAAGAQYLHKLYLLMVETALLTPKETAYACAVNNTGGKGTFSLLSNGVPINLYLVFDSEVDSIQLVWSTLDLETHIRNAYGIRYFFYRFPVIIDRPIFIHTQTICAHWWRWSRSFGLTVDARLKVANAVEVYLYKDPTIENQV